MKSIAFIILYFGKLPDNFSIWLKSCEYNPTINFILFTDDERTFNYPPNIKVYYTTFNEIKAKIQDKYSFKISLNTPYELCDYKVAYGDIFREYIKDFNFWGYCDIDIIWGNIRKFFTEDILNKYDKIGFLGHSTIYKNKEYINTIYKKELHGKVIYKDFFQVPYNNFFDEKGINELFTINGLNIYKEIIFADLTPLTWKFQINYGNSIEKEKNKHRIFTWENGKLYSHSFMNNNIIKDEYLYIHFLRRRMKNCTNNETNNILIIPNKFTPLFQSITKSVIIKNSYNNYYLYWTDFIKAKWKKITIRKVVNYIINRYHSTKAFNKND